MRVMRLPDSQDFTEFPTVGPNGPFLSDINGCAASIECYLDLQRRGLPEPLVRWSAFNSVVERYQGELEHKGAFMKAFLNLRSVDNGYDTARISNVLDSVIAECVGIAEAVMQD